jgi:hypothetical protein
MSNVPRTAAGVALSLKAITEPLWSKLKGQLQELEA